MTTETKPPLPDGDEVDATIKRVQNEADTIYVWNYERERDQLVTLYNKGVSSQWSSVTDLDWATDVDPEELVRQQDSPTDSLVRTAAGLQGSPLAKWGEKEFTELSIEMFKASLSQFMHGEHRSSGIMVKPTIMPAGIVEGSIVCVSGTMASDGNGEVYIDGAASVQP